MLLTLIEAPAIVAPTTWMGIAFIIAVPVSGVLVALQRWIDRRDEAKKPAPAAAVCGCAPPDKIAEAVCLALGQYVRGQLEEPLRTRPLSRVADHWHQIAIQLRGDDSMNDSGLLRRLSEAIAMVNYMHRRELERHSFEKARLKLAGHGGDDDSGPLPSGSYPKVDR